VEISFFYGLALQQVKEYKKAARVYKELVTARPEYAEAWLQYAYTLESLKKYKDMEVAVKQVLALQPNHAPANNLLAYSLAQRSVRLEEAQEYISRALAVYPNDYAFLDTQAWIYFKQGNLDRAAELLQSIPPQAMEKDLDVAYHLGAVLQAQGRLEEALIYLEKARTSVPQADRLYRQIQKRR